MLSHIPDLWENRRNEDNISFARCFCVWALALTLRLLWDAIKPIIQTASAQDACIPSLGGGEFSSSFISIFSFSKHLTICPSLTVFQNQDKLNKYNEIVQVATASAQDATATECAIQCEKQFPYPMGTAGKNDFKLVERGLKDFSRGYSAILTRQWTSTVVFWAFILD